MPTDIEIAQSVTPRYILDIAREAGIPEDAASSEIERALGALGEVDGRSVNEEIIKDIFTRFCVGK